MTSSIVPLSTPKPLIAVIGTEGSGKTVLATTLAKRLGSGDVPNLRMDPQGARTLKYVERVWQTLQSEQWPPSTSPGELFELKWKLELAGRLDGEMRLIDAAGQDMRLLFGDDEIHSIESLPSHLRPLAEYCRGADILLFLVNLKDFLGQADPERKIVNEAFLKSALDYSATVAHPKRICLVLTQADQYLASAKKYGGWEKLVSQVIPNAFNSHIRNKPLRLFPVAAVGETTVAVEKGQKPRKVPKQGFKSVGLDKLAEWIIDQFQEVAREVSQEANKAIALTNQKIPAPIVTLEAPESQKDRWKELQIKILAFIAKNGELLGPIFSISSVVTGIMLLIMFAKPTRPIATFIVRESRDVPAFFFDDGVEAYGTVRNDGADGKLRIWVIVKEKGVEVEHQHKDIYLKSGESTNYYFSLNKIYSIANNHNVETFAEIP